MKRFKWFKSFIRPIKEKSKSHNDINQFGMGENYLFLHLGYNSPPPMAHRVKPLLIRVFWVSTDKKCDEWQFCKNIKSGVIWVLWWGTHTFAPHLKIMLKYSSCIFKILLTQNIGLCAKIYASTNIVEFSQNDSLWIQNTYWSIKSWKLLIRQW